MRAVTKWGLNIVQKAGLDGVLIRILKSRAISPLVLRYCWDIRDYNSYREQYEYWSKTLAEQGISQKDKSILEIGSGSSIGFGYFFLKDGFRKWTASDHFQTIDTRSVAREQKLVESVAEHFDANVRKEVRFGDGTIDLGPRFEFLKLDISEFEPALRGRFDVILSTAVLEHISKVDMQTGIMNMAEYLRPGGVMIHEIDLRDHVNVSNPFNFYSYAEKEWNKLTADTIFYTNRLRASDFADMFEKAGLRLEFAKTERKELGGTIRPSSDFSRYEREDLETTQIFMILKK